MGRSARPQSFLAELRRRRVIRAATVYAVAGWAIAQIASTLAPVLLLPDWIPRAIVLLIVLGFPVAVGLAWAYDVTPTGVRRTKPGEARPAGARPAGAHPIRYAALGGLAMLVIAAAYVRFAPGSRPADGDGAERGAIRSLAVLPFVDMSADGDQEYFSDGITEELLNVLAQLPGLQVAARTSSFAFKGRNEHVSEIGRQLGVQAVLEGSVRRDGETIRVTAQLIDAATGFHVWSDNYDRGLAGILALQDEIAAAIVDALRLRLAGGVDRGRPERHAVDPEAHALYLRGLHHWHRRRTEDFHRSIDYFQQAIARDPGYAAAHAGLALSQITLTGYDNATLATMLPQARRSAQRALELDPELADAHAALVLIARRDGDWAATERHARRALALNPSHITAHHWLSQHLVAMGRFDEALSLARRALELDPLSLIINNNLGFLHLLRGDHDAAIAALTATVELDPTFPTALRNLMVAYAYAGRHEDALGTLAHLESIGLEDRAPLLRAVFHGMRDPAERPAALAAVAELGRHGRGVYQLALFHTALGDHDGALDRLEEAHAERHYNMPYIAVSHELRPLHGEPRFEALVRAMNLERVRRTP
jgi:adenylate cyclase